MVFAFNKIINSTDFNLSVRSNQLIDTWRVVLGRILWLHLDSVID